MQEEVCPLSRKEESKGVMVGVEDRHGACLTVIQVWSLCPVTGLSLT